jgi:hypothetical protein
VIKVDLTIYFTGRPTGPAHLGFVWCPHAERWMFLLIPEVWGDGPTILARENDPPERQEEATVVAHYLPRSWVMG